ncbi:MAG: AI-2E family transporter, partial [Thiohalobacteraceae bacterium]
ADTTGAQAIESPAAPGDSQVVSAVISQSTSWQHAVVGLFILGMFYALYTARAVLLPVVIAALLSLLLMPFKRALERIRLPSAVAAAVLTLGLASLLATAFLALAEPASSWFRTLPAVAQELEIKLRPLQETFEEVNEAAAEVEKRVEQMTPGEATDKRPRPGAPGLFTNLLIGTQAFAVQLALVIFLVYFFLASSDLLLNNFIHALPRLRDKVKAMKIVDTIQRDVSRYLATITLTNTALGTAVALAMHFLEMPNALLWGVVAATMNFLPYIGALITLVVITGVAVLTFDDGARVLLVSGTFLTLTTLEGQILTPTVLGHRLSLNPLVVFIGIVWWGWLWGIAGALIAVPLMVAIKIVFDQVDGLERFGAVMGR